MTGAGQRPCPGFPGGSGLASPVPLKAPITGLSTGALGLVVAAGMVGAGPKGLWEDFYSGHGGRRGDGCIPRQRDMSHQSFAEESLGAEGCG